MGRHGESLRRGRLGGALWPTGRGRWGWVNRSGHCHGRPDRHRHRMPTQDGPPAWRLSHTPGTIDSRVLYQDHYGVTADATVLSLASMSEAHLSAVVRLLRDAHATRLHLEAMLEALQDLLAARETGQTTAEQLTHDLTDRSIASVSPEAWLESTPLMRALRQHLSPLHS